MKQTLLLFSILFIFSGCLLKQADEDSYKFTYLHSTGSTDFSELTEELLENLCPTMTELKNKNKIITPLYVTDFVNISNLDNKSQFGFLLSDELKTSVSQNCNWPIYQIEFSKYLKLGNNGTKLLSRDPADIKNRNINADTYALIGTYSLTQRQLILYLKLIDLNNGVIIKASTTRVTLTDEIIQLEKKPLKKERKRYNPNNIYQPLSI